MENWKNIPNFEGLYEISSEGRVKMLPRVVWNGHNYYVKKGRITVGRITPKGYMSIELTKPNDKKRYSFQVHRLVCISFIDNPNNYPQVNHIDGNKQNNRIENLEWCDNSYNQKHAYRIGLRGHSCNGKHIYMISKDGNIEIEFNKIKDAKEYIGTKSPRLSNILNNNSNIIYHGYYWKFK